MKFPLLTSQAMVAESALGFCLHSWEPGLRLHEFVSAFGLVSVGSDDFSLEQVHDGFLGREKFVRLLTDSIVTTATFSPDEKVMRDVYGVIGAFAYAEAMPSKPEEEIVALFSNYSELVKNTWGDWTTIRKRKDFYDKSRKWTGFSAGGKLSAFFFDKAESAYGVDYTDWARSMCDHGEWWLTAIAPLTVVHSWTGANAEPAAVYASPYEAARKIGNFVNRTC